jgi:hypothetical protein
VTTTDQNELLRRAVVALAAVACAWVDAIDDEYADQAAAGDAQPETLS